MTGRVGIGRMPKNSQNKVEGIRRQRSKGTAEEEK